MRRTISIATNAGYATIGTATDREMASGGKYFIIESTYKVAGEIVKERKEFSRGSEAIDAFFTMLDIDGEYDAHARKAVSYLFIRFRT